MPVMYKQFVEDGVRNSGFDSLGFAIVQKAVEDVNMFTELGIIVDGRVCESAWPRMRKKQHRYETIDNEYRFPVQVEQGMSIMNQPGDP